MIEQAKGTRRLLSIGLRSVGMVGAIAASTAAWRGQQILHFGPGRQDGAWGLAAGLLCLAAIYWIRHRFPAEPVAPASAEGATRWTEIGGVAAAFALGVTFRLLYLGTVPDGLNHDAAWNGMYATHINQGATYTPYVSAAWGRETFFMYVVALVSRWVEDRAIALELAAALSGIAALIPFYFLSRAIVGRRAALIALGFFSVSGWHWVFSRVGWRCILVPPCEIIALFGLWRGLQTGAFRYWMLAGAGAALSINTYNAGRAVPAVMAVLFLVFLVVDRDRWKAHLKGAAAAALSFATVGGPMLWYAATHWVQFQGRAAHLIDRRTRETGLSENIFDALSMFNYRGNGNDFFVNEPLLEPVAAVLFVFGCCLVLVRVWQRRNLFLALGFFLSLLPGLLALPNGNRCITVMPFVYMIIGVGGLALFDLCASMLPKNARAAAAGLLALVVVAAASVETYSEFLGERRRSMIGFSSAATAAGAFMRDFGSAYRTYVVAERWPQYTLTYLGYSSGYPLEPHYIKGTAFSEIEGEISRFGNKGMLFVTDRRPAGRIAHERLQRMFVEHEVREISAPRLGGMAVATALIVEPKGASRVGPWSNMSRSLRVETAGPSGSARARRCVDGIEGGEGVSLRAQLMFSAGAQESSGGVRFFADCSSPSALVEIAMVESGLVSEVGGTKLLVSRAQLEAGRWYDVRIVIDAAGSVSTYVDGLLVGGSEDFRPATRIAAVEVFAEGNDLSTDSLYVDDITVLGQVAGMESALWRSGDSSAGEALREDFEAMPLGRLGGGSNWRDLEGVLSAVTSPRGTNVVPGLEAAENAFDSSHGSGPGQMDEPMGVAVDPAGNIYVSERLNHRVQKFSSDGTLLASWGQQGERQGQFREPLDLAADDQFLYVADTWNHRVQAFDWQGNFAFEINAEPSFSSPRGIFARGGLVYVANSGRNEVLVFDRAGALVQAIRGSETDPLRAPVDVVVDSAGRIVVVNGGSNRLEIFSSAGERIGAIPVSGWQGDGLKEHYIAIDASDTLYVSDWDLGRVRRFQIEGAELSPVVARMQRPSGVAVGGARVIVASRGEHQLRAEDVADAKSPFEKLENDPMAD